MTDDFEQMLYFTCVTECSAKSDFQVFTRPIRIHRCSETPRRQLQELQFIVDQLALKLEALYPHTVAVG